MNDVLAAATLDEKTRRDLDELAQTMKSNLEKVVQDGKRADSIVKNMPQHSREGSGEHRPTEINSIVDESLNLAYHGARAEKAGFSVIFQRDLDRSVGIADILSARNHARPSQSNIKRVLRHNEAILLDCDRRPLAIESHKQLCDEHDIEFSQRDRKIAAF